MSYQVLARKWRPQKFSELVGQEHVVNAISNALENDKLHHAYLFTGTRGVGKTTIARIFSKSLNCETGQSANPCGTCNACVDIDQGRYVDLLEIDAASRTKVEDTRELLDNVQYKPTRGRFKVYLIDEVHMLSKHSFNALLKTLEEPPPHVKFLLATTDPQKLPITILSRCLQFSLKALSREQIQSQLKHVLDSENISNQDSALSHLARAAQGSMRDALSLTDQAIAQGNNQVSTEVVIEMLGLLDKNQVLKLAKAVIEKDAVAAMQLLDSICMHAPDYSQVISELLSLFHQISLTQIVPEVCKVETLSPKALYQLSKAVTPEHIQLLYQIALQGKKDLPFAPDPLTGLEMTILRLLAFSPASKVDLDLSAEHEGANAERLASSNVGNAQAVREGFEDVGKSKAESAQHINAGIETADESAEPLVAESEDFDAQMMAMSGEPDEHELPSLFEEMAQIETQASVLKPLDTITSNDTDTGVTAIEDLFAIQEGLEKAAINRPEVSRVENQENDILNRFMADDVKAGVTTENPPEETDITKHSDEASKSLIQGEQAAETSNAVQVVESEVNEAEDNASYQNPIAPLPPSIPNISAKPANISLSAYLKNGEKLFRAEQIDEWSAMVERLSELNVKGLNKQLLLKSNLISAGDKVVIRLCEQEQHLNEPQSRQSIIDAFNSYYGKQIELELQVGRVEATPEQIQKAIDDMRQRHAEDIVNNDDTIQEIIKAFDGRIVSNSIVPI